MTIRAIGLSGFPLLLLSIFLVERIATILLGYYPASAGMWAISMELRGFSRDLSNMFANAMAGSMALQLAVLALAIAAVLVMAGKNMIKASFFAHHFLLLGIFVSLSLTGNPSALASSASDLVFNTTSRIVSAPMTWVHYTLITIGIAGCICCHVLYLTGVSSRNSTVKRAIKQLQFDI